MYEELKRKENEQSNNNNDNKKNYYSLNLDSFRIFFIIALFLMTVSGIFLFGYWLGKLRTSLNNKQYFLESEKISSKLPTSESSVISIKENENYSEKEESLDIKKNQVEDLKDTSINKKMKQIVLNTIDKGNKKKITSSISEKKKLVTPIRNKKLNENTPKKSIYKKKVQYPKIKKRVKKKVKKNKQNFSKKNIPKIGYNLKVSAHRNKKYAFQLKKNLILKGYHAYILEKTRENKKLYGVYIGPFTKKKDAVDTKKYLKKDFSFLADTYIFKS